MARIIRKAISPRLATKIFFFKGKPLSLIVYIQAGCNRPANCIFCIGRLTGLVTRCSIPTTEINTVILPAKSIEDKS
jgi:hypothetical protein